MRRNDGWSSFSILFKYLKRIQALTQSRGYDVYMCDLLLWLIILVLTDNNVLSYGIKHDHCSFCMFLLVCVSMPICICMFTCVHVKGPDSDIRNLFSLHYIHWIRAYWSNSELRDTANLNSQHALRSLALHFEAGIAEEWPYPGNF